MSSFLISFTLLLLSARVTDPAAVWAISVTPWFDVDALEQIVDRGEGLRRGPFYAETNRLFAGLHREYPIMAAVTVQNMLDVPLAAGHCHSYRNSHGFVHPNTSFPKTVPPGTQEAFLALQAGNSRGTSGTARWQIQLANDIRASLHLMWSIPYSFTLRHSYVAVGVKNYTFSSDGNKVKHMDPDKKFEEMFWGQEPSWHSRVHSGRHLAVQRFENVLLIGQIFPESSSHARVVLTVEDFSPSAMLNTLDKQRRRQTKETIFNNKTKSSSNKPAWFIVFIIGLVIMALLGIVVHGSIVFFRRRARVRRRKEQELEIMRLREEGMVQKE